MSNRFHNKWHRRNHHTYGNSQNPDAAHDPIASQNQPFLGEFVLSGALSAVAPASAFAAFLYSNNTALCAWAGNRGAYIFSGGPIGAQIYSTTSTGISAYGPVIGLNVSSLGTAISAIGLNFGGIFASNNVCLSTAPLNRDGYPDRNNPYFGPNYISKNVFNNRTGIFTENPLSAFHVTGGSYFDGNMTITGDLSVNGSLSRFDTFVYITSSTQINVINNTTAPALYVSDSGNQAVLVAYDADYSSTVPAFIIDGNTTRAANIGINVAQPTVRLDISNDANTVPQTAASGTTVHVTQLSGLNNRVLLDAFGNSNVSRSSFTGRQAGISSNGVLSAVPVGAVLCEFTGQGFDGSNYSSSSRGRMTINSAEVWSSGGNGTYLTFQTTPIGSTTTSEAVRIDNTGNVGINVTSPIGSKLTVNGSLSSANGNAVINDIGSSTTNINSGTSSGAVYIATGSGTLNIGNATGNVTAAANAYSLTTGGSVNINTVTAQTTNINTGSGSVATTIGNSGTVSISGTTTIFGSATIANLAGNTLTIGNATGNVTVAANAYSLTTGGSVNINNSTGRTTNINTGTGAVITTIGNNTASNITTINSTSVTAPNQTYADGTSVITGTLGDARYNQKLLNTKLTTVVQTLCSTFTNNTTVDTNSWNNGNILGLTLNANTTYEIKGLLWINPSTTNATYSRIYYTTTANVDYNFLNYRAESATIIDQGANPNNTRTVSVTGIGSPITVACSPQAPLIPIYVKVEGIIKTNANGSLPLIFQSRSSGTSNTIYFGAGSYLTATALT
jgi:hypothetical protein